MDIVKVNENSSGKDSSRTEICETISEVAESICKIIVGIAEVVGIIDE